MIDQELQDQFLLSQAARMAQPYTAPISHMQGNMIQMTNPEDEIVQMELTLKGIYVDANGQKKELYDPLLNERGVGSVIGHVRSAVNRVSIMSNYTDQDVERIMVDLFGDALIKDLMMNREEYQIKDPSARDRILAMGNLIVFSAIKRALEEGDRRFWKGTQQEITTRIEGMPNGKKKGGMFGFLGGAWKGN